jgi:hypothetical protein
MPKRTYKDLEKLHGVTRDQLNAIKAKGVNVWNDKECAGAVKSLRPKIKPGTEMEGGESCAAQSLEQIEEAIRKATNIDTVKILKEKVMALKGIVSVQQETRELVPSGEVREAMTAVYSVVRAEMLKLTSDLPPQLAGLGEQKIQSILRQSVMDILGRLADEQETLFVNESA